MSIISYLSRRCCKGKIGIVLEGGYEYNATAKSVLETMRGCLDGEYFSETGDIDGLKSKLEIDSDLKSQKIKNADVLEKVKEIFKV